MAAALFGGVGAKTGSGRRKSSNVTTTGSSPSPTPSHVPKGTSDSAGLLDLGDLSSAQTPVPISTPSSSSADTSVFDMLNASASAPAPAPVQAPTLAPPVIDPNDIMSLDFSSPVSSTPLTPTNNITSSFGSMDLLGASMNGSSDFNALAISTAEFGGKWGSLPHETKQSIPVSVRSLQELQGVMPSFVGHVESIKVIL